MTIQEKFDALMYLLKMGGMFVFVFFLVWYLMWKRWGGQ